MRSKELARCLLILGLSFVLTSSVHARAEKDNDDGDCKDSDHHKHNAKTPVGLVGVIPVPGKPITSADIAWVDPGTERYYFADRSNSGVDIIDAERNVWVARVPGMAGPLTSGGGTTTTNGPGPNGVLVTPNRKLWAGDGNSTVRIADVDPDSTGYLQIIQSVSTSIPACDNDTAHYCGRADELGYDPRDKIILVANNAPLSVAAPHAAIDPYATFISAAPPYNVLGHITFVGAGGLEQPLWDPEIRRFFLTVPGKITGSMIVTLPSVAVINPGNPDHYIKLECFGFPQQTPATIAAGCDTVRASAMAAAAGASGIPGLATSCPNIRGNVGRNALIGPGLVNFDFSVFKNNYIPRISESFNVQFRSEFFNIFNRANFATPPVIQAAPTNLEVINSAGAYVPLAGKILATQTPGRVIQFALKVIW